MTNEQLQEILTQHKLWLEGNSKGKRAILCRANLSGVDLRGVDLRYVDLRYANLCEANLRGAIIAEGFISNGKFHHISNVGSENETLELYGCPDNKWYVKRGSFSGSKEEFINRVKEAHGDNEYAKQYLSIIEVFCN